MSSALALVSTIASISSSPVTLLSMIPLIAVGLNYYRYSEIDPESPPIDAPVVSLLILLHNLRFKSTQLSIFFLFLLLS